MHHAQYISGRYDTVLGELCTYLEEHNLPSWGHPDFWSLSVETCGIDEARQLAEYQSRKALAGSTKVCVLGCGTITREAQNALLKTTEEPVPGTHIFLVLPRPGTLLPTLRSRLAPSELALRDTTMTTTAAQDFLKSSYSDRLKQVATLLKELKETGQHEIVEQFIHGLLTILSDNHTSLLYVAEAEEELQVKGVPPRFILERLALTLPQTT